MYTKRMKTVLFLIFLLDLKVHIAIINKSLQDDDDVSTITSRISRSLFSLLTHNFQLKIICYNPSLSLCVLEYLLKRKQYISRH